MNRSFRATSIVATVAGLLSILAAPPAQAQVPVYFNNFDNSFTLKAVITGIPQEEDGVGVAQGFEEVTQAFFLPIGGKASEGSSLRIVTDSTHSGKQALKLSYIFSGRGHVEFNLASPPVVAREEGRLTCTLWCQGAGKDDFGPLGLRLVDSGGETFQYPLDDSSVRALNGSGWREINTTINLSKPQGSWGAKHEGTPRYPLRFLGFGLGHRSDLASRGEVVLDDLSFRRPGSEVPVTPPVLQLLPVPPDNKTGWYFYAPGAPVTVQVQVQGNNLPKAVREFRWETSNFAGERQPGGKLMLDAQGTGRIQIPHAPDGITYVTAYALNQHGDIVAEGETRIAVLRASRTVPTNSPQPTGTSSLDAASFLPFLPGIAAHLSDPNMDMDREATLIATLGFRACRAGDSWSRIQPQPNVWNWTQNDKIFETMARHGITVTPLLAYSTIWATTGDPKAADWRDWNFAPPKVADFAVYAGEMAKRYGRYTRYWEVWNEPDNSFWRGDAKQYAATFDATYDAIHRVQPDALVMNGGFSEVMRRPTFIPDWQAATQRKPDVFAYHTHMAYANMLKASARVKNYLKNASWNMPVWLNESGFSSVSGNTEREQAIALVKKMSSTSYLGFNAYFWYDLRDDGTSPTEIEHHFGLVRTDGTPKAAAVATHTLLSTLRGQRFVQRLPVKGYPQVYALVFEMPDRSEGTLVLWNEEAARVPLLWNLPGKAASISMMGTKSDLKAVGSMAVIAAGQEPVFIGFQGAAQKLTTSGSFLEFAPEITGIPGETVSVPVRLYNPLNRSVTGTLSWVAAGKWNAAATSQAFNVPAKARREVVISLKVPPVSGASDTLRISLKTTQLPELTTAQIPLKTALIVPRGVSRPLGDVGTLGEPLVTLDRANVVGLFEVAPLDNLLFRGDSDLNAKMYLARVPEGLRVTVRVQDDVFFQNEAPGEEWKGDSLQLGLALPGGKSYEWVAALTPKGPQIGLSVAPQGVSIGPVTTPVSIRRQGTETVYEVLVPANLPGGGTLPNQFRFSFLVNDNDGGGRKGWIEWTPGIGKNKDPNLFRSLVVR